MSLSGRTKKAFNRWRFDERAYPNKYFGYHNDYVMLGLYEEWLGSLSIHLVPTPIIGLKNGNDSFPINGWRIDILGCNKGATNSYHLGYPILDWLNEDEIEDYNGMITGETIVKAKLNAIKIFNDYNNKNGIYI